MQEYEQNQNENLEEQSIIVDQTEDVAQETEAPDQTENKEQSVKYIPVPVYIPVQTLTPEQQEKKAIKRASMLISLACLIMTGITFLWSTVYFAVMGIFGVSQQEAYYIANDPFVLQVLQIIISTLMFTLPFIIVFKLGGFNISETVELARPPMASLLPLTLIGIGFCSFANIAVSIAGSIFQSFGVDYSVDYGEDPEGILGFIISFIATAIVPALVEEFACRGLILGSLKKFGEGFAIIVSSAIFGLIHGNFEQIPFAFLIGLVLGFITVKSGSIWIACLIHSVNNAVSVVMSYLTSGISVDMQNLLYNVYLMLALLLAIVGAVIYTRRKENAFRLDKAETVSTEPQKHKWFFTQPLTVILVVICLIESLAYFF